MRMRLRPNVLAHPSPTTGRFLLLIVVVLGGVGMLSGTLTYNSVRYHPFKDALRACIDSGANDLGFATRTCMAPEYRVIGWFQLGGAVVMALLGLLVLAFSPLVASRRHKLRPATIEGAQARVAELAAEAGLSRPPGIFVGPVGQRDAFVFGLPGAYRLVLPKALLVRWRTKNLFDPVVQHELAHLVRHDVPLAWLAASAWIAAIPVLFVPIVLSLFTGAHDLALLFAAECALLLGVVWLARRQVLRSREHDADLHASRQEGGWHPLWTLLQTSTGRPRAWLRQWISNHPSAAERMAVLADPARLPAVSFVDGLIAALLAGSLVPLLSDLLNNIHVTQWNLLWAGLALGPVVGIAVGAGLWRQALVDHVNGETSWPGGVVAGVVCGLILADWLDFSSFGLNTLEDPRMIVFAIFLGSAATTLSAATGRLWADAAGRLPEGRRGWAIGLIVNSLFFGLAFWALQWFPLTIQAALWGGLGLDEIVIGVGGLLRPLTYVALIPVAVTMVALVLRRRVTPVPAWLLDGGPQAYAEVARRPGLPTVLLSGVASGGLVALAILVHRLIAGSPVDDDDRLVRYLLWVLTGTFAAMAVSFMAVLLIPRSGAAVGLVTGLVTAMTAGLGIVMWNTFLIGNPFEPSFWWLIISTISAQWFIGYLLVAPFALVSWSGGWRDMPGWLLGLVSVLAAGLVSLIAVGLALA
jgi:Zn-dependent protease with chaperone function